MTRTEAERLGHELPWGRRCSGRHGACSHSGPQTQPLGTSPTLWSCSPHSPSQSAHVIPWSAPTASGQQRTRIELDHWKGTAVVQYWAQKVVGKSVLPRAGGIWYLLDHFPWRQNGMRYHGLRIKGSERARLEIGNKVVWRGEYGGICQR